MSTSYLDANGLNALASCFFDSDSNTVHIGPSASASNYTSTAIGCSSKASLNGCTAVGYNSNSSGTYATCAGSNSKASANAASFGAFSSAGIYGAAVGQNARASGGYGTAIGAWSNAYASSVAAGYFARASYSDGIAVGSCARTTANGAVLVGVNLAYATENGVRLGNDYTSALECAVELTTTSDSRDKTDVEPISNACCFLANVQAVTYLRNPRAIYQFEEEELDEEGLEKRYKYGMYGYDADAWSSGEKKGERQRVGVIAQDVQAALEATYGTADYANLVNDSLHDYDDVPNDVESQLSVNYSGFVPFLIEAVNELRERVESLEGASE